MNRKILVALAALCTLGLKGQSRADDGIFPPAPAAKATIDFDGRGFLINGKRTFLASGSLHYARVPRELWRDRLLKFKRAGFNCVETYTFWNVHEPKEGQFNFAGNADLDAFLTLAQSLGLYAIVRVGPYSCAEWENGGYPMWLRNKPDLQVRQTNAAFEKAVDDYFGKLIPIVARHQIHRGGNVVMVQLENEHPQGWGRDAPNEYFRHLRDTALRLGLEVPWFFSGLHHGSDPAGDRSWDSKGRNNPWFTTEFWPGWYDLYGPLSPQNLRRFDRGTWKILAYGGNGYNYYMLHGGTNFDYFNGHEDASCYDYGAAVGQTGDLRPIYYRFKRAATFATSFAEILESSENADANYQNSVKTATGGPIKVTARTSAAGDIAFLDNNNGDSEAQAQFVASDGIAYPKAGPITLKAGEILPVVQNYGLAPNVKLDLCVGRVLGVFQQGKTTTLAVYNNNDPMEIHFTAAGAKILPSFQAGPSPWTQNGAQLVLTTGELTQWGNAHAFQCGDQTIRVLTLTQDGADKTWMANDGKSNWVVCGTSFLRDATLTNGKLRLDTESPMGQATSSPLAFGEKLEPLRFLQSTPVTGQPVHSIALQNWQVGGGNEPIAPQFNDAGWMASENPQQMNSDGDLSPFAWYRTSLNVPANGAYQMAYSAGGGDFQTFLDGKKIDNVSGRGSLSLNLTAGPHNLAIFASHAGRDKFFNYLGPLATVDIKGLNGPAFLSQSRGETVLTKWTFAKAEANAKQPPANANGTNYNIGDDAFDKQSGWGWFQTTLPAQNATDSKILHFTSVDEDATVFLNGQQIGGHEGWNQAFDADIPAGVWKNDGPNILSVLIHNQSFAGGIDKPVSLLTLLSRAPLKGWKMRGGPYQSEKPQWKPFAAMAQSGPQWFRSTFDFRSDVKEVPILRVKMGGMSRGSVWLNGHNLGRYPERVPVDGLYLPESWLLNGANTLAVFDEEGNSPEKVAIEIEPVASRDLKTFVSQ